MSLQHATAFVQRMRDDADFRWEFGACKDQWERRRFMLNHGYRFSPAELACATSPRAEPTADRVALIERARRHIEPAASNFF